MPSPCIGCDLEHADKRNPKCLKCNKRWEYVEGLGGMTHGMPDNMSHLTDRSNDPKQDIGGGMEKTKICRRKSCKHNGEPQPLENFTRNKSTKDGLAQECKDCKREYARNYKKRKAAEGVKVARSKRKATKPKPAPKKPPRPAPAIDIPTEITIDFTDHPETLQSLASIAKEQFRNPSQQALYMLHNMINGDGGHADHL